MDILLFRLIHSCTFSYKNTMIPKSIKKKGGELSMSRPYTLRTNEWGESERVYLDSAPPSLGMPDYDMGGVSDDPWGSHRDWQREHQTHIKDVRYGEDSDPYGHF